MNSSVRTAPTQVAWNGYRNGSRRKWKRVGYLLAEFALDVAVLRFLVESGLADAELLTGEGRRRCGSNFSLESGRASFYWLIVGIHYHLFT